MVVSEGGWVPQGVGSRLCVVSSQTEAVVSKTLMKSNATVLAFTTDLSRWYRMLFYGGLGFNRIDNLIGYS